MHWVLRSKKDAQHTCSKVIYHRYAFSPSEAKEYMNTFADGNNNGEDLRRFLKCKDVTGMLTDLCVIKL